MRRSATIARSALQVGCLVALLLLTGCMGGGDSDSSAPQAGIVAPDDALKLGCGLQEGSGSSRSDPQFREKSLVIGPVVIFPARSEYPRLPIEELRSGRFPLNELLVALVRGQIAPGDAVTLRLTGEASRHAAFFSSRVRFKSGGYRISEGAPALVATACEAGPGFRLYTTYNVGFLVDSARCVTIAASVDGERVGTGIIRFATTKCSSIRHSSSGSAIRSSSG